MAGFIGGVKEIDGADACRRAAEGTVVRGEGAGGAGYLNVSNFYRY